MIAHTDPVKSFFVEVITRDISLTDAILDLLDNCVDGILRSKRSKRVAGKTPFKGFAASICFTEDGFEIADNCGGFDRKTAEEYAFRFGRPKDRSGDEKLATVGIYGIGMKRAIFKMGRSAVVQTSYKGEKTKVSISPKWIEEETNWDLPLTNGSLPEDGTKIVVNHLIDSVKSQFRTSDFEDDLIDRISEHYAYIIEQGFEVTVNAQLVTPKPVSFYWDPSPGTSIKPFVYEATRDGVSVYLTVGLWEPPRNEAEIEDQQFTPWKQELAGWTVVCNHRVVAYCDKTSLTGWVQPLVPRYHSQFSGIRGYVEFVSKDASKLPTNSTKHGLDSNSELYLLVQTQMIRGTKQFTDFTNEWKGETAKLKKRLSKTNSKSVSEMKVATKSLSIRKVSGDPLGGKAFRPKLPKAPKKSSATWIRFSRPKEQIDDVAEYYAVPQKEAGAAAFDDALRKSRS